MRHRLCDGIRRVGDQHAVCGSGFEIDGLHAAAEPSHDEQPGLGERYGWNDGAEHQQRVVVGGIASGDDPGVVAN